MTTLVSAGILVGIGAIVEFQTVKAKVVKNEKGIAIVSKIICKYAIKDKLKDADKICVEVLKSEDL
jgi:hypothetical protein